MGWALDGGEDIGGEFANDDYWADYMDRIEEDRCRREKNLKGKYLIVCKAPSNGRLLYLQDRRISKRGFWTKFKNNALGFSSKSGAEKVCSKLKYNNPSVILNK